MKKIYLLTIIIIGSLQLKAQQYPYLQNFDSYPIFSSPADWTNTVAGFQIYPGRGVGATQVLTREFFNLSQTDSIISPLIGSLTGTSMLSFDYRIVEYIGATPLSHTLTAGDKVEIKIINGGTTTTVLTIDLSNHIEDAAYATRNVNLSAFAGNNIGVMIKATWAETPGSSFFVEVDNFKVQDATGVNELISAGGSLVIYPNPVTEALSIHADGLTGAAAYTVTDVAGREFMSGEIKTTALLLPVGKLAAGVYFLKINGGAGQVFKFIKQ